MKILSVLTVGAAMLIGGAAFAQDDLGAKTWKAQKCETCHGAGGKADTKIGQSKKIVDMTTADFQKKATDDAIKTAITKGVDKEEGGVQKKMKAYDKLKPEEVDALLKLIRSWAPKA